jgi:hypothetical protein
MNKIRKTQTSNHYVRVQTWIVWHLAGQKLTSFI